ncbi:MAG: ABC transporter ATP-binding protein [Erysipelothrix sp.]|jgi:simple sugar transport system ATP-binding protein|nr:ABC transporter ATP-binding protein [Erysipelothrix sp.]
MEYVIEMIDITKIFPGVIANDHVSFKVKKGEIHALLGENGAGKSTLMSILFGLYQPDAGTIKIKGETHTIHSPNDANALGIGMVHQHFKLVETFTVLENIVLGVEEVKRGMLNLKDARQRVVELSELYNLRVDPDAYISDITVGQQQRVEILKMLYRDNDILIFDEPTAVLTPQEIEELMHIMRQLIKEGKSIVFITHKLNEIKMVADRVSVLRRGQYIGTVDAQHVTREEMSEMMVGRKVDFTIEKDEIERGDVILSVRNLTVRSSHHHKAVVNNVSFDVRAGEILCLAGIEGNGQSELVYAISGMIPIESGSIKINGEELADRNVFSRYQAKMAHIPEDRHKHGLVLDFDLSENLVLQRYHQPEFQKRGFINFKNRLKYANHLIEKYDIRAGRKARTVVRSMSGGNQQKAIVAREIDKNPDIILAVTPTRGLDVGAIEYIHKQLIHQRDNQKAVLLISLELNEVMEVSDRILVMYEGEFVGEVTPRTVTQQELGLYMSGSKREEVRVDG